MRVRVVLAVGLALIVAALALNMSRAATRTAGSDHIAPLVFVATLDGGQVCQAGMVLPGSVQSMQLTFGTYGHALPALASTFTSGGRVVASGLRPAGARDGVNTLPLHHDSTGAAGGTLCIRELGRGKLLIGGESSSPAAAATVSGATQPGRIAVIYTQTGRRDWWQLLPTLAERFGFGKSPLIGSWTLLAAALLLLGVWVAAIRLLLRELA